MGIRLATIMFVIKSFSKETIAPVVTVKNITIQNQSLNFRPITQIEEKIC